jgi:biopolymer transport protein ExbD
MADIAFLLLIFFLVTTVFPKDRGLPIVLPEEQEEVEVSQRNILHITSMARRARSVCGGGTARMSPSRPHQIQQVWRTEVCSEPQPDRGVRTHPEAAHRYMVQVLDALQMANAERISLQMGEG